MLQYTTKSAYKGNTWVETYKDGYSEGSEIVADYELGGYIRRLEDKGYERAFDVEESMKKFEEAQREFLDASENFLHAIREIMSGRGLNRK